MATLNFDASNRSPVDSFDPMPAGNYPMVFTESENKATKAGTGSYLQLTAEVIDGPYKGRKVWERLNLDNPNSVAVSIAEETLTKICHATGVLKPADSSELHDKPFLGVIKYVPTDGQYDAKNELKGYKPLTGKPPAQSNAPAQTAANPSTQQAPAPTATASTASPSNWWDKQSA